MDHPYPDFWQHAISGWFDAGRHEPDQATMQRYIASVMPDVEGCWQPREGGPMVRPSSGLSCAQQLYLLEQGAERLPPSEASRITWAQGHLLHGWIYGCIVSGLPEGITHEIEFDRELPAWWPKDRPGFAQIGHTDLVLRRTSDTAGGLPPECGTAVLVDVKSTNHKGWTGYKKKTFGTEPDGFGYMSQLGVYSDGGTLYDATFLLAVNRNSAAGSEVRVRQVPNEVLADEADRLRAMFARAGDPGLEFHERWGKAGAFYCDMFCDVRDSCPRNQ